MFSSQKHFLTDSWRGVNRDPQTVDLWNRWTLPNPPVPYHRRSIALLSQ